MNALEILNNFIEEGNPPDELSLEWPDGENAEIRFGWDCGTVLTLPNVNGIYISVWARFQEFWFWPEDQKRLSAQERRWKQKR